MNSKTEVITWSRYYLSLLYSFGYTTGKLDCAGYFSVLKDGKRIDKIKKDMIFIFLAGQGHDIKLGTHMNKKRMNTLDSIRMVKYGYLKNKDYDYT